MRVLKKILAVLDGGDADATALCKAVSLARWHGAELELFLCDAQRAYSLSRTYDPHGIEEFRRAAVRESRRYLEGLRDTAVGADVRISVDAACESPLYEGIVRKVMSSRPDLVIKSAAGRDRQEWDANDWQLMRACPATLLLSRGHCWGPVLKLAAAVDVSECEASDAGRAVPQSVIEFCASVSAGSTGNLEVLYSEAPDASPDSHRRRALLLDSLAREAGVAGERVHILRGEPEQTLPAFASDRGYDALVMGALTHRVGVSTLIGTLTAKLVETLGCDFVLVKPPGYAIDIDRRARLPAQEMPIESPPPQPKSSDAALGFVAPWELPPRDSA